MSLRHLIERIPRPDRQEMLKNNVISNATGQQGDYYMQYLMIIWRAYFEPDIRLDCNLCLGRVLKNFREMQQDMIDLEKEQRLLDGA